MGNSKRITKGQRKAIKKARKAIKRDYVQETAKQLATVRRNWE